MKVLEKEGFGGRKPNWFLKKTEGEIKIILYLKSKVIHTILGLQRWNQNPKLIFCLNVNIFEIRVYERMWEPRNNFYPILDFLSEKLKKSQKID